MKSKKGRVSLSDPLNNSIKSERVCKSWELIFSGRGTESCWIREANWAHNGFNWSLKKDRMSLSESNEATRSDCCWAVDRRGSSLGSDGSIFCWWKLGCVYLFSLLSSLICSSGTIFHLVKYSPMITYYQLVASNLRWIFPNHQFSFPYHQLLSFNTLQYIIHTPLYNCVRHFLESFLLIATEMSDRDHPIKPLTIWWSKFWTKTVSSCVPCGWFPPWLSDIFFLVGAISYNPTNI